MVSYSLTHHPSRPTPDTLNVWRTTPLNVELPPWLPFACKFTT